MAGSLMRELLSFASRLKFDTLPDAMKILAKYAAIDVLGVALAGWSEPAVNVLREVHLKDAPRGRATLWGEGVHTAPSLAALMDGTASHALDYDDVSMSTLVHPSAPILSAVMPLAEVIGSSGKEVLAAYAVGTETMARVGQAMGYRHYEIGWHATSTLGAVGAAASCGYILRLEKPSLAHAVAIAGSMASGLRRNFGTMTKPLHVGLAASHGVEAALLAQKGFTGSDDIFGDGGYLQAFACDNSSDKTQPFGRPFDLVSNGLSVKKFPCCYETHKLIQAALNIRERETLSLDSIESVTCVVPAGLTAPLIHHRPTTGLQAKFSGEFTVAVAFADGRIDFDSFEARNVGRPDLKRMLKKVVLRERSGRVEGGSEIESGNVVMKVRTKEGAVYSEKVYSAPGSKQMPLTEGERREKWVACLRRFVRGRGPGDRELTTMANGLFVRAMSLETGARFADWLDSVNSSLRNISK